MMNERADFDPPRDAELTRLLRVSVPGADAEPKWGSLRERIVEQAALPLARRRRGSARRWVQAAVGIGAAACLAVAVHLAPVSSPPVSREPVLGSVTEQDLDRLISGEAEREALVQAILEGPQRDS